MTRPPAGATASVERDFFVESLVRCQEEGVQEAALPCPQAWAPPGIKMEMVTVTLRDHLDSDATKARRSSAPQVSLCFSSPQQSTTYDTGPRWGEGTEAQGGEVTSPRMQLLQGRTGFEPRSVRLQSPPPSTQISTHFSYFLNAIKLIPHYTFSGSQEGAGMALPCFTGGETEATNEEGHGPGTDRAPPLLPTSCLVNDVI